jgi:hypothetical protein
VASLGVALMRASGIPAQYVSGTLSQSQAQQLILSMFPASDHTVGLISDGTPISDPADDPRLLAETESHYWFQFDAGNGIKDADPLLPQATIGQSFTVATGTFTEVPDNLRAKTEIQLVVETDTTAENLFGLSGLHDTTVLDQTFNDADLVGRSLSLGHLITSRTASAIIQATTNTYSPYLIVGDVAQPDLNSDTVIRGQDYQEILTNFPLGSQVITGVFLNFTEQGPGQPAEAHQYTVADRIGAVARNNGQAASVSINPQSAPLFSPVEVTTFSILPSELGAGVPARANEQAAPLLAQLQALQPSVANPPAPGDPAREALANTIVSLIQKTLVAVSRAQLAAFLALSDTTTALVGSRMGALAYFDSPRITILRARLEGGNNSPVDLSFAIDLNKDDIRAVAVPGQTKAMGLAFNMVRGQLDTSIEANVIASAQSQSQGNLGMSSNLSAQSLLAMALAQGVTFTLLSPTDLALLDGLALPPSAKVFITEALAQGKFVLTPAAGITVNGALRLAWLEIDPNTGASIGVLDDGTHAGQENTQLQVIVTRVLAGAAQFGQGLLAGGIYDAFFLTSKAILQAVLTSVLPRGLGKAVGKLLAIQLLVKIFTYGETRIERFNATLPLFVAGFALAAGWGLQELFADPPVLNALTDPSPTRPTDTGPAEATVPAAASRPAGAVDGTIASAFFNTSGTLTADWQAVGTSGLQTQTLSVSVGTVRDGTGNLIGSGTVGLSVTNGVATAITGTVAYGVTGKGSLAFYGPSESSLGVSANWDNYTATVTGNVAITLTTDGLTFNGQSLPAGTYTITTSSATLTGSGPSTSPSFSGTVTITATASTVHLGPGTGNLVVGGNPLDPTNDVALTGYTGTLQVVAGGGNNTDSITLHGNAANVLAVSAAPTTRTTDQNAPVTFQVNVNTSLADTYNLSAQAPPGWTVTIDNNGTVTATPAPGLQAGVHPIQIVAQSSTNPDLLAQTTVNVTILPTSPGFAFAVNPDPEFTVPFNGAQVPSAFRAMIHNTGPATDTYNLTLSNLPSGFTVRRSAASLPVSAGQTGFLGIYLQATGSQLPAPGTQVSFLVTATSATNPALTQSQTVMYTVPAIDGVTVTANPTAVSTTPGVGVTDTLTLTNVGNVNENNIALTATTSSGLTVSGLAPVSLQVGQSTTEKIMLAPDAATPLNSLLQATITVTFGPSASPQTQTLILPVNVVVPGATAIANAAVAAGQLGNTNLANRLNDLSIALTNLVQNPTSRVFNSQALAALDALIGLLGADRFLAPLVPRPDG